MVSTSLLIHYFAECGTEKIGQKVLEENEVQAVLRRLDKLTQDEAQTTAAQTLQMVYGLVQNVKVVMDSEKNPLCLSPTVSLLSVTSDYKASTDSVQEALSMLSWWK